MEKDYSKYIEIASIISMNDAKVIKNVSEYINNSLKHNELNGVDEIDKIMVKKIWMGLANILIENGYVDKDLYLKSGLYSFVDNISKILSFAGIEVDEDLDFLAEVKEENKSDYSKCIEIAKIISKGDETVVKKVSECISDPLKYFENYNESYDDRGMDEDDDIEDIIWIGVLDILIEAGYIIEEDWKEGLYSFVDDISSFKLMQEAGIEVDEDIDCLDEDDENGCIASWAGALDNDPVMQGFVIGCYDIGADCYDFFVCTKEELETLSKLAEEVGHRICRCSEC